MFNSLPTDARYFLKNLSDYFWLDLVNGDLLNFFHTSLTYITYLHHLPTSLTYITLLTHHLPTSLTYITYLHHLPTSLTYITYLLWIFNTQNPKQKFSTYLLWIFNTQNPLTSSYIILHLSHMTYGGMRSGCVTHSVNIRRQMSWHAGNAFEISTFDLCSSL